MLLLIFHCIVDELVYLLQTEIHYIARRFTHTSKSVGSDTDAGQDGLARIVSSYSISVDGIIDGCIADSRDDPLTSPCATTGFLLACFTYDSTHYSHSVHQWGFDFEDRTVLLNLLSLPLTSPY